MWGFLHPYDYRLSNPALDAYLIFNSVTVRLFQVVSQSMIRKLISPLDNALTVTTYTKFSRHKVSSLRASYPPFPRSMFTLTYMFYILPCQRPETRNYPSSSLPPGQVSRFSILAAFATNHPFVITVCPLPHRTKLPNACLMRGIRAM